ncbi:hypothetical protein R1N68_28830, partial [Klebsiella sp. 72742]|uniref:hypothetical protein n=1 Tax=Klebsiella sp. 72742 TaxID=3079063 RepID=UPI003007E83D
MTRLDALLQPRAGAAESGHPECVLLVENSRVFAEMLATAVRERLGLAVDVAGSLAEARQRLDPARHFLVLTGLVLP